MKWELKAYLPFGGDNRKVGEVLTQFLEKFGEARGGRLHIDHESVSVGRGVTVHLAGEFTFCEVPDNSVFYPSETKSFSKLIKDFSLIGFEAFGYDSDKMYLERLHLSEGELKSDIADLYFFSLSSFSLFEELLYHLERKKVFGSLYSKEKNKLYQDWLAYAKKGIKGNSELPKALLFDYPSWVIPRSLTDKYAIEFKFKY